MTEHAQVSRAALGILGTRAGIYPIKIIVALIVAPLLGTTNYGIYSFLLLPTSVILPLMTFGIGGGVRFYISNEQYEARHVTTTSLLVGFVQGGLTAALVGVLWRYDLLGETGRAISFDLLLPVLMVLPLHGIALILNRVMVGASWFTAMNVFIFLNNLAPPIFLTTFVIIGGLGVAGAVWSIVATDVALSAVCIAMVYRRFRPRFHIDLSFLGESAVYGIKSWIGSLASYTSVRFDQFVVGFVQAPEALGVYRIAVMVAELLWLVPDAVNIPLFNRISRTEKAEESVSVITQSHRVLIAVVSALSLTMFAVGWWGIPLVLGQEYIDARWLLGLLIPGAVALVTSRLLGTFFNARGVPEKASLIQVIGAAVSMVCYLTLIPLLGVAGAAIGTSISYVTIAVTSTLMFGAAAKPYPVRLFRPTGADIRWAYSLVRDSFAIWHQKMDRAR